jgi:hypothetical protein
MDEMSNETDVRRIELAEESANWRALTAGSDIAETLAASLDEMRTRHAALMADLPKAIAEHTAAVAACDAAQRRRNTVIGRINRVAAYSKLAPALETIFDAEDQRYRTAQIAATKARQALAQLKWDIECLGANIAQTESVLAPPSPQLMEAGKRPQAPEIEVDDIVFAVAPTRAA